MANPEPQRRPEPGAPAANVTGMGRAERHPARASVLAARGLTKRYRGREVVRDVALELRSGEVVGLLGPNGAGKTTCFYMIVGLVALDGGEIHLEARRSSRTLRLVVENQFDPEAPPRRQSGMGLRNVRTRLEARYGGDARLEAGPRGDRYRVEILLPAQEEEKA